MEKFQTDPKTLLKGTMWPKIGAILTLLAFIIFLVSFGSPHWAKTNRLYSSRDEHLGLWRKCTYPINGGESCTDFIDWRTDDWHKSAQAFMTLAFFTFLPSIAAIIVLSFLENENFNSGRKYFFCLLTLGVTALFLFIGITTWAGKYQEFFRFQERIPFRETDNIAELSWAFFLAIVSLIFVLGSIVLVFIDMIFSEKDDL